VNGAGTGAVPGARRVLRIGVLYGLWPTNIGNAFLQLGARALMQRAVPGAEVFLTSATPHWLMESGYEVPLLLRLSSGGDSRWRRWLRRQLGRVLPRYDESRHAGFVPPEPKQALSIASIADCDVIVLPGMVLCEWVLRLIEDALRTAVRSGVRLLFVGAGMEAYSAEEAQHVGRLLEELQPLGLLSRDRRTYDLLASSVEVAAPGIDCGFFVRDAFRPPPVRLPAYVVATFDRGPAPALDLGQRLLVHAHHRCFGPIPPHHWGTDRTLISDLPEDYLTLYANASEVHSSRVHACVAALSYGVPARLYSDTPRAALFESVGAAEIRERVLRPDAERIERGKAEQAQWVAARIRTAFPDLAADGG
jgi:hypothetical protein